MLSQFSLNFHLYVLMMCVGVFVCVEHSRCVMTLLQSFRGWRPLTEGISIPRIPFVGGVLCPGMSPDKT